jgi:uncharacterized protein YlxW (UPF0749 family)
MVFFCGTAVNDLSMQELVQLNTRLQVVARTVAAEAEKTKEEVAAGYRAKMDLEQAALQTETERLRQVGTAAGS